MAGTTEKNDQYIKMTETPVRNLIIKLSIPTTISMLIMNVYNLVDTAFVGQLGTSASGSVGIVFGFMAILQAGAFLFGQGCGNILSRSLGSQNNEAANKAASTGLCGALLISVIIAILSAFNIDNVIKFLGSTPTIAPYAKIYITYILISAPFIVMSFVLNNILRFEGKAMLGMIGMLTGAILNMIGDPILIFGLNMGIHGAGLSTCVSQIISFIILISFFLRGKTTCKLRITNVDFKSVLILDIMATGLPSLLRQGLASLSTIILNLLASPYGDPAIAAMSIVSRISFFVFSVCLGIGQGFQPVGGFNYGAKKYGRVREAYKFTVILGQILITILTIGVLIFANDIIVHFRNDPEVITIGTRALILQCLSQLVLPVCTVTEMQLQSAGKKLFASVLSSLKSGVLFIPILLIMAKSRGLNGIEEAQPIANLLMTIPSVIFAVWFFKNLPSEDVKTDA